MEFRNGRLPHCVGDAVALAMIDRHSPIPRYYQLARILIDQIDRGILKAGDRLPSETELEVTYQVSRTTVRQCLAWLREHGQIETRRGEGSFVARRAAPKSWIDDELSKLGIRW